MKILLILLFVVVLGGCASDPNTDLYLGVMGPSHHFKKDPEKTYHEDNFGVYLQKGPYIGGLYQNSQDNPSVFGALYWPSKYKSLGFFIGGVVGYEEDTNYSVGKITPMAGSSITFGHIRILLTPQVTNLGLAVPIK